MATIMISMTYLGLLAILDVKKRELSLAVLGVGSLGALFCGGYYVIMKMTSWEGLLWGTVPGVILLLLAGLTKSAGLGDGIVLLQMNLFLLLDRVVFAFGLSLIIMGAFSAVFLLVRRGCKDVRLPYLPFLWLGCLGSVLCCG